jgi:putative transposase
MGFAITPVRPSRAEVIAALRASISQTQNTPFCGVPDRIQHDGGLEFSARDSLEIALILGIADFSSDPHSPHQNGKIERLHSTMQQTLLHEMPGYSHGPRRLNKSLYGPGFRLALEAFHQRFTEWTVEYNTEYTHSELGMTPLEAWTQDPTPLRLLSPDELRHLLPSARRKVERRGVRHNKNYYIAPELRDHVGDDVIVRFDPGDLREVYVYLDDRFLCTANPQATASPEERRAVLEARRRQKDDFARQMRVASMRARRKFKPMTAEQTTVVDTEVITTESARTDLRKGKANPRAVSRTDLLVRPQSTPSRTDGSSTR